MRHPTPSKTDESGREKQYTSKAGGKGKERVKMKIN